MNYFGGSRDRARAPGRLGAWPGYVLPVALSRRVQDAWAEAAELVVPVRCAGCGAPGGALCARCRQALRTPPLRTDPRVATQVPVFALGPWQGPRRAAIVAAKEMRRRDVLPFLGAVLAAGLEWLEVRGEITERVALVPAPTTVRAARARGGDIVTGVCAASGRPTHQVLAKAAAVGDQVGRSAAARAVNARTSVLVDPAAGALAARQTPVVVVDDVITTGATVAHAVAVLQSAGVKVVGIVGLSCA